MPTKPTYSELAAQLRQAIATYQASPSPEGRAAIEALEARLRELDESVMQPHYFVD